MHKHDLPPIIPSELSSHRYLELDALRGLAASTVVFHHLLLLWNHTRWYSLLSYTPLRLLFAGPQAVVLFFVLSGFVLSGAESSPKRPNYFGYLLKRLCRIYLPFLAALLIAYCFALHFFLRTPTSNAWINATWNVRPRLWDLIQTAFTTTKHEQQFNTAFWTVFLEIRISLIFPFLFLVAKRLPAWAGVGLTIASFALLPFVHNGDLAVLLQTAALFLLGALGFLHHQIFRTWWRKQGKIRRLGLIFLSVLAYAYGIATIHIPVITQQPQSLETRNAKIPSQTTGIPRARSPLRAELTEIRYVSCAVASLFLLLAATAEQRLRNFLHKPALIRLGGLSYSMYLIHGTVLFAMIRAFWGIIPNVAFILIYFLLVYAASELFHLLIDTPALKLGRKVGKLSFLRRNATV